METANSIWKSWPNHALIILFAVFLMLPTVDMVFHIDPTSPRNENRVLAPWPASPAGIDGLTKYLSGWEAYFNDHFGCRRVLIMWHSKLMLSLFKDDSHEVLVGRGGWLYFTSARMIDHFRGELQFSEADLRGWQDLLERRRDWLAKRHIKFVFVVAPDKQSIYPEYLPAWLTNPGRPTKADQFAAYMKAHSSVTVLDLRPILLAAKKSGALYQQTDTHWNQLGAFIACDSLLRSLADDPLPGVEPLALESFNVTNPLASGGDLARMLGTDMVESNAVYFSPKPELPPLTIYAPTNDAEGVWSSSRQSGGGDVAIVYHDSFGHYWIPFLGYQFKEVDYFRQTYLNPAVIEEKRPAVVICEVVERFLNTADPAKLSAKDALP